eukprot:TRINITY_DN718_c0_g1_i1.p1 TRINITY_DN718_c0_g1~~TRINITY_DN718_c0_g1_i1.p1  ORF type:complete len:290 (-),score=99.11 TRINITY_DN718_c0_g1_i1:23-811(-)
MKEYTRQTFGEEAVELFGGDEISGGGGSRSTGKLNEEGIEFENFVPKSIKFAYLHSSPYRPLELLKQKNEHMWDVNISPYDENRTKWPEWKNKFRLDDMNIVIIDGGNMVKSEGEGKEIGDDVADYVDKGGVVVTLGYGNAAYAEYSPKGRWKTGNYQVIQGPDSPNHSVTWDNNQLEQTDKNFKCLMDKVTLGTSFSVRSITNNLAQDAEVLIGTKTYPIIARRKVQKGWVYSINTASDELPVRILTNLIRFVFKVHKRKK